MSTLFEDWVDFCEGRKNFDSCHFYCLFHADPQVLSNEQLEKIFSYFSGKEALLRRMVNIFDKKFGKRESENVRLSDDKLIELAQSDLAQRRRICVKESDQELCQIIDEVKAEFTNNYKQIITLKRGDGPDLWLNELVDDHMRSSRILSDNKTYALFEALYGLTTDYRLVWYVGFPLVDKDINTEYFFKLWDADGDYVLTHDKLLVSRSH